MVLCCWNSHMYSKREQMSSHCAQLLTVFWHFPPDAVMKQIKPAGTTMSLLFHIIKTLCTYTWYFLNTWAPLYLWIFTSESDPVAILQPTLIFTLLFHRPQFKSHVAILAWCLTSGLRDQHMSQQLTSPLMLLAAPACLSVHECRSQVENKEGLSPVHCH